MSRYFIPNEKFFKLYDEDERKLSHPYDIAEIRKLFREIDLGTLTCNDFKLEELWGDFSDQKYSAGFLSPDRDLVVEFLIWLGKRGD